MGAEPQKVFDLQSKCRQCDRWMVPMRNLMPDEGIRVYHCDTCGESLVVSRRNPQTHKEGTVWLALLVVWALAGTALCMIQLWGSRKLDVDLAFSWWLMSGLIVSVGWANWRNR